MLTFVGASKAEAMLQKKSHWSSHAAIGLRKGHKLTTRDLMKSAAAEEQIGSKPFQNGLEFSNPNYFLLT